MAGESPGLSAVAGRLLPEYGPDPLTERGLSFKIGAKVVSHGRYVTFQMAEVAVPRQMFQEILMLIAQLRAPPAPT
jgi:hypothetical protein